MFKRTRPPVGVRVPGLRKDVGLGDAVKVATSMFGIKPCGACQKRAERLNQMLTFKGGGRRGP